MIKSPAYERYELIVEMRAAGATLETIAARFEITKQRVSEIIKRPPPEQRMPVQVETRRRRSLRDQQRIDIVRAYGAGERIGDLAAQYGVSATTIYRIVTGRVCAEITGVTPRPLYSTYDPRIRRAVEKAREGASSQ